MVRTEENVSLAGLVSPTFEIIGAESRPYYSGKRTNTKAGLLARSAGVPACAVDSDYLEVERVGEDACAPSSTSRIGALF